MKFRETLLKGRMTNNNKKDNNNNHPNNNQMNRNMNSNQIQ